MNVEEQISVVIPTWNEAAWLRSTLEAIRGLSEVAEVIVSDNASLDETAKIAKEYGCTVVAGGSPAVARNRGAEHASGRFILFLDADTVMPKRSLHAALKEFWRDAGLVACVFRVEVIDRDRFARFGYLVANAYFRILARWGLAQGLGNAILVRKQSFDDVSGFDEQVGVGEDVDLLRRMSKKFPGGTRYFSGLPVGTSARRFKVENKFLFSLKVIVWTIIRLTGARWSPIRYAWKGYPQNLASSDMRWAARYLAGKEAPNGEGSA